MLIHQMMQMNATGVFQYSRSLMVVAEAKMQVVRGRIIRRQRDASEGLEGLSTQFKSPLQKL